MDRLKRVVWLLGFPLALTVGLLVWIWRGGMAFLDIMEAYDRLI